MQTSVFKLPISPVISGQNIIDNLDELDDLNSFENQLLLAQLDSIDFTERGITIDGKLCEIFFEVPLDNMMERQQKYLYTLWEEENEQDRKRGEPSLTDTNDKVSVEQEKERISQGL